METIGASHSLATARHFSSGTMSLRLVEYSRMRPQPVQVRLQVCSGSSCRTMANLGVRLTLCLIIWPAIFAESAKGNRIVLFLDLSYLYNRNRRHCGIWLIWIRMSWRGISFEESAHSRQDEIQRRNAFRSVDASATRYE